MRCDSENEQRETADRVKELRKMKKKMIISSVVLIVMVLFVTMQYTIRDFIGTGPQFRGEEPYYQERAGEESKAREAAAKDAGQLLDGLSSGETDAEVAEAQVAENLRYCLENFAELRKGDDAEMEIVKKTNYSVTFLYLLIINTDYDGSRTTTDKEKALWKAEISLYTNVAEDYAINCNSLTQEETDFLEAEKKGRQISDHFDEAVEVYVKALIEVVEEAKEKNWI